jgi:DNA-directed RNA polymerase specialized sigma24 family protein
MTADAASGFAEQRARLVGLDCRLLSSAEDAEGIVQEAFLRWARADRAAIMASSAGLTKVVTSLCLNRLALARVQRGGVRRAVAARANPPEQAADGWDLSAPPVRLRAKFTTVCSTIACRGHAGQDRRRSVAIMTMSRPASARGLLQRRCKGLVAAETARLPRRVPALREHLGHVEAALGQVIDRLVLSRARAISGGELAVLFDLAAGKDTLFLYSFMFVPDGSGNLVGSPYPDCTSIIDAVAGEARRITQRVSLAVSAKAPIGQFRRRGESRGWGCHPAAVGRSLDLQPGLPRRGPRRGSVADGHGVRTPRRADPSFLVKRTVLRV